MRITRLIAGTVSAGLLGITPIALAAPSSATDNLISTTTLELPFIEPGEAATYGDTVTIRGAVTGNDGSTAYDGTVTLYQITSANPAGVPVATVPASGYLSFPDIKATANSVFRAVYSGYTATNTYEDNYTPSTSADVALPVQRKVSIDNAKARLTIKGKVAPKYAKKKVKVQIKKGKRYVKFKTIKTDRKSKFQVRLPAPRRGNRLYFKITIPGNADFVSYSEVWYTYSYRAPLARAAAR
ncbi:hypothetical protein [Nocardioides xinjiangensis]|uniref:hypothetical protein n=1 Tax=Nocardioides xinjiangensis TaxID=2817376 RepID=UPI001B315F84|nr:hypothetical protein [Nocardioides sp. SYSU D00514]